MTRILLLCSIFVAALAHAQPAMPGGMPGMPDPAQMSGIPRPDRGVPARTLTVRLIRQKMTSPITDREVELIGTDGKTLRTEKTDAQGRATFADLDATPFLARAKDGDETLMSQPVRMPADGGVRVLLAFGVNAGAAAAESPPGHAAPASMGAPPAMPGMPDPTKMSGIPRPDSTVPAHTITVRVIREKLDANLTDHPVELVDKEGKVVGRQKTDAQGRASFANLGEGPYNARSVDESGQELVSQPITLPAADTAGVRVLLAFRASALGTPDGVARHDKSLPAGTIVVNVLDESGAPADNVSVLLVRAAAGDNNVKQDTKSTAKGVVRFEGQSTGSNWGYLLQLGAGATKQSSTPFRLPANLGVTATFRLRRPSGDRDSLVLGRGSHVIIEIGDQALNVSWVLELDNSSGPVDLGSEPLRFTLPQGAVSASLGEDPPAGWAVEGNTVAAKAPIRPGRTEVRIFFGVPYHSDALDFSLGVPVPLSERAAIVEKVDKMTVDAPGLTAEERELNARPLLLLRGAGIPANGQFSLTLRGLPNTDRRARNGAMFLAGLMLLVGLGSAFSVGDRGAERLAALQALETERDKLFSEAQELPPGPELKKKLARLAEIYKKLDESDA